MPITILNKVWNYCKNDKKFLVFILILIIASNYFEEYFGNVIDYANEPTYVLFATAMNYIFVVFITGYGISITNDWINNSTRLPKIDIKKVLTYGIK